MQSPVDPRRRQNRVPTQIELNNLRNDLFKNRQLLATMGNRIGTVRDERARTQLRYDKLLRELDCVKWELQVFCDYLTKLEKQENELRGKDQELQGLLHPIRRCPDDILRLLFEYVVYEEPDNRLRSATALSNVCRSWRTLALNTSRFWSQVVVSLKDNTQDLESFSNRTRARLRSIPADVIIKDVIHPRHYQKHEFMKSLQLDQFKSIDKIHYILKTTNSTGRLKDLTPGAIAKSIKSVSVEVMQSFDYGDVWKPWSFVKAFPAIQSLSFCSVGDRSLEKLATSPSLKSLTLCDVILQSFSLKMAGSSMLEELKISYGYFNLGHMQEDIVLSQLHTLTLLNTRYFPWRSVSVPQLWKLVTEDGANIDDMVDFCCRHMSLRELAFRVAIDKRSFTRLSAALSELETLEIIGNFDMFSDQGSTETLLPPFPKLQHLTVDISGIHSIDYNAIDSFLRIRYVLPKSAETFRGLGALESLDFIADEGQLQDAGWRSHPLLDHCTQTLTKISGGDILQLRWN